MDATLFDGSGKFDAPVACKGKLWQSLSEQESAIHADTIVQLSLNYQLGYS